MPALMAGVVELVAQLPPVTSCPPFAVLFRSNDAAGLLLDRVIDALCQCGPTELTDAICAGYAHGMMGCGPQRRGLERGDLHSQ